MVIHIIYIIYIFHNFIKGNMSQKLYKAIFKQKVELRVGIWIGYGHDIFGKHFSSCSYVTPEKQMDIYVKSKIRSGIYVKSRPLE